MLSDQKEWLANSILCWIDYETCGLDSSDPIVYPIEVGVLLTKMDFEPVGPVSGFSALIDWGFGTLKEWSHLSEAAAGAFPYHKISPQELVANGQPPETVASYLVDLVQAYTPGDGRCILISDNIQFEWQFTKRLLERHPDGPDTWPFHYCGWDTSVLQLVSDLGFVDPPDPEHRALSDVIGLWQEVRHSIKGTPKLGIDRSVCIGLPCGEA